jgi:hypothetical protein
MDREDGLAVQRRALDGVVGLRVAGAVEQRDVARGGGVPQRPPRLRALVELGDVAAPELLPPLRGRDRTIS